MSKNYSLRTSSKRTNHELKRQSIIGLRRQCSWDTKTLELARIFHDLILV